MRLDNELYIKISLIVGSEKNPQVVDISNYKKDKKIIGISWKSTGIDKRRAQTKNAPLTHWSPILSQEDCYFVNLQYGDIREEIEAYAAMTGYSMYIDEQIDPLSDLDGFAAQVSSLDLIVSTSNTTVHMSGGLGKKVWV